MKQSTKYRSGGSAFPPTSHSTIRAVWSSDESERSGGFEALISAYWMPVYKYLRIRWQKSIDDAKDLTQAFFLAAMEKDFFRTFDPERARFRTFLRTCLDGFVSNHDKSAKRLKRGGAVEFTSLDFQDAENQMDFAALDAGNSVEAFFEREWRRSVFNMALDLFQTRSLEQGRELQFKLFEKYVLDGLEDGRRIKYDDLARQFGLSTVTVTNYLAAARRDFRRAVFDKLRELTVADDEFRREARTLLGVEPE
jgi:RNA polymerase sigma factor (sigma-70 family)